MRKSLILTLLLLCLAVVFGSAAASAEEPQRFPDNVIEVPQGTEISINDDAGTVTITACPVDIAAGDTFIVYLQDLPIGYVAQSVRAEAEQTVIVAEKADKSVYSMLVEEGVVNLTGDMYEFIPASSDRTIPKGYNIEHMMKFEDGKLTVTVSAIEGSSIGIELSDMHLQHSFSDGGLSASLSGDWKITCAADLGDTFLNDVELGEMRIYGVGKIALYLDIDSQIEYSIGGSFSAGFSVSSDGEGSVSKSFGVNQRHVEGKGTLSLALKITAGIDILVAESDIYAEIGVESQFRTRTTEHPESNPPSVYCEDIKFYFFSKVGAEAKCVFADGNKTLASAEFELMGENASPFLLDVHFENGVLVNGCSQGMNTGSIDMPGLGGQATDFGSTLLTDSRVRVLETDVTLPWDVSTDGDFTIAHGTLNLNGHTLTINGDLIQTGGMLLVGNGTLVVHGDYRLQTPDDDGGYWDSTGCIKMNGNSGEVFVNGDFVVQTGSLSNEFNYGTFHLGGDLRQINAFDNMANFQGGPNFHMTMAEGQTHTITFDNPDGNALDCLELEGDASISHGMHLKNITLNGCTLTVCGDLLLNGSTGSTADLSSGTLSVEGDLLETGGTVLVNGGTLEVDGDYYIAGSRMQDENGAESLTKCSARLNMTNEADTVSVGGSFLTNSMSGHTGILTAGTLYVGGDFTQLGRNNDPSNFSAFNFNASGTHKVVFDGSGVQTVSFESTGSGFADVSFACPEVCITTPIRGFTLKNDVNVPLNGSELKITGSWDLAGHTLSVEGDLLEIDGTMLINGGTLEVDGDYYIAGSRTQDENGEESLTRCTAILNMTNEADTVSVGGSFLTNSTISHNGFLTAGTLYVGGDFTQLGGNNDPSNQSAFNFRASEGHRTVLNGSAPQNVSFESTGCFGTLELRQPLGAYTFTLFPCWITLVPTVFGDPDLLLPDSLDRIEGSAMEGIAASVVYIPDSCTYIGAYAFRDSAVSQVRIPSGCVIDDTAFSGCEYVVVFGTPGSDAERFCEANDNCTFVEDLQ